MQTDTDIIDDLLLTADLYEDEADEAELGQGTSLSLLCIRAVGEIRKLRAQIADKPAAPVYMIPFTDTDMDEIHQFAYELGGTDGGEYTLDGEQLEQVIVKTALLLYKPAAPAVPEDKSLELESALEQLVNRCNNDAVLSNDESVIHAEAVLESLYKSRALLQTTGAKS